ncbi:hypothetical protein PM10SUCC1_10240 [Propionigenium maris DSM 9537]|uniref:Uncharacterized protein n=1 Tax=Propionigenium maris DSM 9537 TaxID=1123000 RepID=A0A9W6GJX0_9FUSO|nr:hypothetical protein [Propionigenium maris]GLI55510.1 hypothetical protein PM10SUCC1_10240 [Propionigenium maris DSM 9537]
MSLDLFLKVGGGFCIFYSLYLYLENFKLKKQIRANSWLNYHRVTSTAKTLEEVIALYKSIHRSNLNTEVLEPLIRVDSHTTEFSKGIIHQIQMYEPSFEEKDFSKWHTEGKINNSSLRVFKAIKLTNPERKPISEKFRGWLRKQLFKEKKVETPTSTEK